MNRNAANKKVVEMQLLGNKFKLRKDYPSAPVSEDTITRGKQFDSLVQKHGPVEEQVAHYLITRDKLFDTVLYYIKHEQPLPLDWQLKTGILLDMEVRIEEAAVLGFEAFEDFGLELEGYKPLKTLVGSRDRIPTSDEWLEYLITLEVSTIDSVSDSYLD
ncbi:hypothetical protein HN803_07280 [candidate division WWE3 bacterium]|nr:hypothetical protein [candidate division WWE3 bacterium]